MKKEFDIESLERRNPFLTPSGYFEGLPDRILSSIDASEPSIVVQSTTSVHPNVYGMIRHKERRPWIRWASLAACICGIAFMALRQSGDVNEQNQSSVTPAVIPMQTAAQPVVASTTPKTIKSYANRAYSLSEHLGSAPTSRYEKLAIDTGTSSAPSNSGLASPQPIIIDIQDSNSQLAVNQPSTSTSDIDFDDIDVLDYTDMGISEVYDYLAGNDIF